MPSPPDGVGHHHPQAAPAGNGDIGIGLGRAETHDVSAPPVDFTRAKKAQVGRPAAGIGGIGGHLPLDAPGLLGLGLPEQRHPVAVGGLTAWGRARSPCRNGTRAQRTFPPVHWLDGVSAWVLARTPPHKRVFRRGWGDPGALDAYLAEAALATPIPELEGHRGPGTHMGRPGRPRPHLREPGRYLPDAARTARARLVGPPSGTDRAVVLMASWNDQGYDGRRKLAVDLAARGIASALLEQPLYGARGRSRTRSNPSPPWRTSCGWGRAAVARLEGGCWPTTCCREGLPGRGDRLSMGGNMAGASWPRRRPSPWPRLCSPPLLPAGPPFLHGTCRRPSPGGLGGDHPRRGTASARPLQRLDLRFPAPPTPARRRWWRRRVRRLRPHRRRQGGPSPPAGIGVEWVNGGHGSRPCSSRTPVEAVGARSRGSASQVRWRPSASLLSRLPPSSLGGEVPAALFLRHRRRRWRGRPAPPWRERELGEAAADLVLPRRSGGPIWRSSRTGSARRTGSASTAKG